MRGPDHTGRAAARRRTGGAARRSDGNAARGLLQVRAGGHLDGVGRGDVDRLTGLRVAAGAGRALGALDGQQAGDGDLLAAGDRVDELLLQSGERGVVSGPADDPPVTSVPAPSVGACRNYRGPI